MPGKEKSIEAQIKEHEKYLKQCQVRVKSGSKLLAFILLAALLLTWYKFELWKIGVGFILLFTLSLLLEFWGFNKHRKAIEQLKQINHV